MVAGKVLGESNFIVNPNHPDLDAIGTGHLGFLLRSKIGNLRALKYERAAFRFQCIYHGSNHTLRAGPNE